MENKIYKVLFVCSGNSVRSIFGEQLIKQLGQGRFIGYSAGMHPQGKIHPLTIDILNRNGLETDSIRSKNIEEFISNDSPTMDFIFTVCDRAAEQPCPTWPGQPLSTHWSIADPSMVKGNEVDKVMAFRNAFRELRTRIEIFVSLPIPSLDKLKLQSEIDNIEKASQAEVGV